MNKVLLGTAGVLTLLLSACNSALTVPEANAQALQGFQTQKLSWQECDITTLVSGGFPEEAYQLLGKRIQCADIKVPMDWNNPSHGQASVALLRVGAADQAKKQGSIFFNPGGPGGDGLLTAASIGYLWEESDPSTTTGATLKALSEQYDVIGFSPRGVGDSSQISCGSSKLAESLHYPSEDRSKENIDRMLRNSRIIAEACQRSPMGRFVNTEQTARDLNLARQLLGEEKLNYVGYSYGTWLGAWYAKTFPQQTGHMLLDSSMAFNRTLEQAFMLQPMGFERTFREVALPFAARHDDVLGLGATKDEVYATYNAFPSDLKYALQAYSQGNLISNLYHRRGIPAISLQLVSAQGIAQALKANPEASRVEDLLPFFEEYRFSSVDEVDETARSLAPQIAEAYFSLLEGTWEPVRIGGEQATGSAVRCNDTETIKDPNFWIKFGNDQAQLYPLIGGQYTMNPCMYWEGPTAQRPATPSSMPPIMMVQSEMDATTPKEGALEAWKSLPNAYMVFIDNEVTHGPFPYGTDCVDYPVASYLLNGTLPKDKFTACEALPLPGEDRVYPVGEDYVTGVGPQSLPGDRGSIEGAALQQHFNESDSVKATQELLQDIIERNAF